MASNHKDQLPPINFEALASALLDRAHTLVPMWLPGGSQRGHEYTCGSLQGGSGTSCSVNLINGKWADFATDERGNDLVSLYAKAHDLTMGKAAVQVARECGLEDVANVQRAAPGAAPVAAPRPVPAPAPVARPRVDEGWATVRPVPAHAPEPTFYHQHRKPQDLDHRAEYRVDGALHGFVMRFRTSEGGKDTLPYTWCTSARDGASCWKWKTWDEPRPLYYPGHTSPGTRTVVLVEGEKKADALQALLDAGAPGVYCVASWAGGCKAWRKADWNWLAACTVLLWPDCDAKRERLTKAEEAACKDEAERDMLQALKPLLPNEKQPGISAMLGIGALLQAEQGCAVQMLPVAALTGMVPDGWDCADAIHTDGWDFARVAAFFGQAGPLPLADVQQPAVAGSGELDAAANTSRDGLAGAAGGGGGGRAMPDWLAPYFDADKGRWMVSRKLVIAALEHDPALCEVLGMNQLSNSIEARQAWPWVHGKAGPITGTADLMLGDYLTRTYGLPSIARAALMEGIETVAHARPFHPIRDWLTTLKHDGKVRIDKWLIYVLGLDPETLTPQMEEYLKLVGRYWLLGMVNRVMEPGCKFDYCPVLEGPGGLGKSTLAETLAGLAYFSDTHFDIGKGKDGQEQVQGLWVYEIAELANFGKAEIGLIKAFITAKVDRYRPAYGRTVEAYARQCVLVGTTNESTYLRDRTGNRRFWPIPVTNRIKNPWVARWREQLFAEAYQLYLQGERFTPTPEEEARLFVPMQESRMVETAVISELMNVLTRQPLQQGIGALVHREAEFVTISQLTLALGVDAAKSSPALEAQVRGFLDHEGWERVKKQVNGVRAWGYARPRNWPKEEPASPDAAIRAQGATGASTEEGADDEPF